MTNKPEIKINNHHIQICQCSNPDLIIEGITTKYYACDICNKPVKDEIVHAILKEENND